MSWGGVCALSSDIMYEKVKKEADCLTVFELIFKYYKWTMLLLLGEFEEKNNNCKVLNIML